MQSSIKLDSQERPEDSGNALVPFFFSGTTGIVCEGRVGSPFVSVRNGEEDVQWGAFADEVNGTAQLPWRARGSHPRLMHITSEGRLGYRVDFKMSFDDGTALPLAAIRGVNFILTSLQTGKQVPNFDLQSRISMQIPRLLWGIMTASIREEFERYNHVGATLTPCDITKSPSFVTVEALIDDKATLKLTSIDGNRYLNFLEATRSCRGSLEGECLLRIFIDFIPPDIAVIKFVLHKLTIFRDARNWKHEIFSMMT